MKKPRRPEDRSAPRHRTANLDADRVAEVVGLVERLPGRPTWADVTAAASLQLKLPYTRQALSAHPVIRLALRARRLGAPALQGPRPASKQAAAAKQTIKRLRNKLEAANRLVDLLMEKHLTWIYNAHSHGLTEADLNQPLPPPGRA